MLLDIGVVLERGGDKEGGRDRRGGGGRGEGEEGEERRAINLVARLARATHG